MEWTTPSHQLSGLGNRRIAEDAAYRSAPEPDIVFPLIALEERSIYVARFTNPTTHQPSRHLHLDTYSRFRYLETPFHVMGRESVQLVHATTSPLSLHPAIPDEVFDSVFLPQEVVGAYRVQQALRSQRRAASGAPLSQRVILPEMRWSTRGQILRYTPCFQQPCQLGRGRRVFLTPPV